MQAWVEWQHLRKPHVLLKALKAQTSMQTGWILLNKQQNQFYLLLSTNRYSKIPLTNVLRGLFIPDIHPINPSIHPSNLLRLSNTESWGRWSLSHRGTGYTLDRPKDCGRVHTERKATIRSCIHTFSQFRITGEPNLRPEYP